MLHLFLSKNSRPRINEISLVSSKTNITKSTVKLTYLHSPSHFLQFYIVSLTLIMRVSSHVLFLIVNGIVTLPRSFRFKGIFLCKMALSDNIIVSSFIFLFLEIMSFINFAWMGICYNASANEMLIWIFLNISRKFPNFLLSSYFCNLWEWGSLISNSDKFSFFDIPDWSSTSFSFSIGSRISIFLSMRLGDGSPSLIIFYIDFSSISFWFLVVIAFMLLYYLNCLVGAWKIFLKNLLMLLS